MKNLLTLTLMIASLAGTAAHADSHDIANRETRILAQTLARQVVVKKLLPREQRNLNSDIKIALDGPGRGTTHVWISNLSCEAVNENVDNCSLAFYGELNNGRGEEPEYSFSVDVTVEKGNVVSAMISGMAG